MAEQRLLAWQLHHRGGRARMRPDSGVAQTTA